MFPKKLATPAQVVTYWGFLFDTRGIPCLHIPLAKWEWVYAIVQYLWLAPLNPRWSRLSLAVVAGVQESLIEATPRQIRRTYSWWFHVVVHSEGLGTGYDLYLTLTIPTPGVRKDLERWARTSWHALPFLSTPGGTRNKWHCTRWRLCLLTDPLIQGVSSPVQVPRQGFWFEKYKVLHVSDGIET